MVNPSGIQLDMINTIAGYEDTSPDWIWDSAGRVNDRGYAVEIRLPLQTIRFKGGADVQHGHPVLAPRQPHGRVGRMAGARAGQVGVREAREAGVLRSAGPADPRGDPVGDLLPGPGARDAVGLGRRRQHRATSG